MPRRFVLLALFACFAVSSDAAYVRLLLDGEDGEFISQGQLFDLTYDDEKGSTVAAFLTEPIDGAPSDIRFFVSNAVDFAGVDFSGIRFRSTQLGAPLTLGTYNDAVRATFEPPGVPGLGVTFAGRGANMSSNGSFTITQLEIDAMGNLQRFSADFTHFADSNPNELRGSITYLSAIPEPAAVGPLAALVIGTAFRRGRRRGRKDVLWSR